MSINDLAFKFPLSSKKSINDKWMDYLSGQTFTSATRPTASSVPEGTTIYQDDVKGYWVSIGGNWMPLNGSATLSSSWGRMDIPKETITGVTSYVFNSEYTIPANILVADKSLIEIEVWFTRLGTAATNVFDICLGTSATASNQIVANWTLPATNNLTNRGFVSIAVHASSITSSNFVSAGGQGAAFFWDRDANISVASPMKVQFGVRSGNIADTYNLVGYQISLKQV